MPLTDTFIKTTKPSGKPAGDKHSDGGGLYLHVKDAGKYWRMAYRIHGKQKTLALGVYPEVSLAQARQARDAAKVELAQGVDPSTSKREAKIAKAAEAGNTFEAVAREFHRIKLESWSESHAGKWLRMAELYLFPMLGRLPISSIKAPSVLQALRKVESKGILSTAHTVKEIAGQVCRFAVQTGRMESNPVPDLNGALKPHVVKRFAAITDPVEVGKLLRAIDGYSGSPLTVSALQLSALLFQRPGNIRAMEWAWVDLDKAMLTIPPTEMKRRKHEKINGRPHLVPLAAQAVAILAELRNLTGSSVYVFPGVHSREKPMSENTINKALRTLGYTADDHVGHGFRAMARTVIAERIKGIDKDMVEAQLAHKKSGPLGDAYDRAEYLDQRFEMMQTWADYLDQLRQGAQVIQLRA